MKTYLFSYVHQGTECVLEIQADSADDACKRVARLQYATFDGELMAKIPVSRGMAACLSPILSFMISILPSKSK